MIKIKRALNLSVHQKKKKAIMFTYKIWDLKLGEWSFPSCIICGLGAILWRLFELSNPISQINAGNWIEDVKEHLFICVYHRSGPAAPWEPLFTDPMNNWLKSGQQVKKMDYSLTSIYQPRHSWTDLQTTTAGDGIKSFTKANKISRGKYIK